MRGLALAYGVRAKGDTGHHAAALTDNATARDLDDATDLRVIRAGSQNRAEKITLAAVNDAIDILNALLIALPRSWKCDCPAVPPRPDRLGGFRVRSQHRLVDLLRVGPRGLRLAPSSRGSCAVGR